MELFRYILSIINWVIIAVVTLAFSQQLIYTCLFFLPKRKLPKTDKKNRIGVFIPARNEEGVIRANIRALKASNYPSDMFDIFVIANNCTDKTAKVAREMGATVFEYEDNNPKHKRVSYSIKYFFDRMIENEKIYDFYVKFDADNEVDANYLSRMNDAYNGGYDLARGFNASKNLNQNIISAISGIWYIRDCRFACHARDALNSAQMMIGPGMMVSDKLIREDGGWKAMSTSEDAEFTMQQLFKKRKAKYVYDAIVYEDQPSTIKDVFNRNVRMGHGLNILFFKQGIKSLGYWFKTFDYSYLDMFINFLFIPIAALCTLWFPAYYIFEIVYNLIFALQGNAVATDYLINLGILIAWIIGFGFLIPFIGQAILVYFLEKDVINTPFKKLLPSMLCFPAFMIIYALGITWGVLTKPKWKQIKRNVVETPIVAEEKEEITIK